MQWSVYIVTSFSLVLFFTNEISCGMLKSANLRRLWNILPSKVDLWELKAMRPMNSKPWGWCYVHYTKWMLNVLYRMESGILIFRTNFTLQRHKRPTPLACTKKSHWLQINFSGWNTHFWFSVGVWSWWGLRAGAELWTESSCVFPAAWCTAAPENWAETGSKEEKISAGWDFESTDLTWTSPAGFLSLSFLAFWVWVWV